MASTQLLDLPEEIITEALDFLDAQELDCARRVCRLFDRLTLLGQRIDTSISVIQCSCDYSIRGQRSLWREQLVRLMQRNKSVTPLSFCMKYYGNDWRSAYIDIYLKRIRHQRDLALIVVDQDMQMHLYELSAAAELPPLSVKRRTALTTKQQQESADINQVVRALGGSHRQPTPSPFGDLLAVSTLLSQDRTCIQVLYMKQLEPSTKRLATNSVGRLVMTITVPEFPFYSYWSPDGQYLTWLSSYRGRHLGNTNASMALFGVNVLEELFRAYLLHKKHTDHYENMWDFYDRNPRVVVEISTLAQPIALGAPCFYSFRPLVPLPADRTALQKIDHREATRAVLHRQGRIIEHVQLHPQAPVATMDYVECRTALSFPPNVSVQLFQSPIWLPGDRMIYCRKDSVSGIVSIVIRDMTTGNDTRSIVVLSTADVAGVTLTQQEHLGYVMAIVSPCVRWLAFASLDLTGGTSNLRLCDLQSNDLRVVEVTSEAVEAFVFSPRAEDTGTQLLYQNEDDQHWWSFSCETQDQTDIGINITPRYLVRTYLQFLPQYHLSHSFVSPCGHYFSTSGSIFADDGDFLVPVSAAVKVSRIEEDGLDNSCAVIKDGLFSVWMPM